MTTGRYISLLETSWILYRLRPFHTTRAKQIIKSPKLYISDSGLAAFLCGIQDLSRAQELLRGSLLETYVAQNLLAIAEVHLPDAELHFWREHRGGEVDFVIKKGRKIIAVEVKSSSRLRPQDWRELQEFMNSFPGGVAGIVAYSGKEVHPIGKRLWAVPLSVVCS